MTKDSAETLGSKACWFVGASFGGTDDQTSRLLAEGIWELKNPTEKDATLVKSMRPGDRIAIKAAYTRICTAGATTSWWCGMPKTRPPTCG
jgi:hypothetical protein